MTFSEKLLKRREEMNLDQDDVAEFFGENFSRQSVSKWESGNGYPNVKNLLVLAVKLDFSLDDFFSEDLSRIKKEIELNEGITIENNLPKDNVELGDLIIPSAKAISETFSTAIENLKKDIISKSDNNKEEV